jgi:positive regulator of sigma E activity
MTSKKKVTYFDSEGNPYDCKEQAAAAKGTVSSGDLPKYEMPAGTHEDGKHDIAWHALLKLSGDELDERLREPINIIHVKDPDNHLTDDMYRDVLGSSGDLGGAFEKLVRLQEDGAARAAAQSSKDAKVESTETASFVQRVSASTKVDKIHPKLTLWRHNNAIHGKPSLHAEYVVEKLIKRSSSLRALCVSAIVSLFMLCVFYFIVCSHAAAGISWWNHISILMAISFGVVTYFFLRRYYLKCEFVAAPIREKVSENWSEMMFNKLVYLMVSTSIERNQRDIDALESLIANYYSYQENCFELVGEAREMADYFLETGWDLEIIY